VNIAAGIVLGELQGAKVCDGNDKRVLYAARVCFLL
jgi:hypothetical protein